MTRRWQFALLNGLCLWGACLTTMPATAAVPNSLVLNEANTVGSSRFLDEDRGRNRADVTLGRIQGNGQNWMELLVVQGDELPGGGYRNTLDVRGWKIEWSYDKNDPLDPNVFGSGTIEFTQDPQWAAVPRGTLITFNEWKQAWYHDADTDPWHFGGLQRDGGIGGLGTVKGDPYDSNLHELRDFSTNVGWNPNAGGGGANGDWLINVWAGERNPDTSFKYFNFTGSVTRGEETFPIGTEEGGLYALNNDSWQWTIKDAGGNVIQGPLGETLSNGAWSVGSDEMFRLENFPSTGNPTQASYLGVTVADYRDGSSSAFSVPNTWSSGAFTQGLNPLRNWLVAGDVDLDGVVTGNDLLAWQRGLGIATGASLTDGDLNGDGAVNAADLEIWKAHFPPVAAAATEAVPEGSSAALTALAGALLAAQRQTPTRRRQ